MKDFLKIHRRGIVIGCILLVIITLIVVGVTNDRKVGLDTYKNYGIGLFADVSAGYSRIQSDQREYTADDVICITVSTAFLDSLDEAELVNLLTLYAEDNPVFDVSFDLGQPCTADWDQSQSDVIYQETYWVLELPCEGISSEDLIYKRNIFNSIKPYDFDFQFHAYFKVKEDAPENWSGTICLTGFLSGKKDKYGNPVGGNFTVDYLQFRKQGDVIIIG